MIKTRMASVREHILPTLYVVSLDSAQSKFGFLTNALCEAWQGGRESP